MTSKRKCVVCLLPVLLILAGVAWYAIPRVFGLRRPVRRIILISIDTCRADYIGCYNPDRRITPNIDAFAQQATLFENARTPVPITLPAHCSMLTGLVPPTHGVRSQPGSKLSRSHRTLASVLRGREYSTGAIVSSFVLNAPLGLEQGFDSFNNVPTIAEPGLQINERRGQETSGIAIQWLGQHKDDKKFFLFLHYYDPHLLYNAPPPFADHFGPDDRQQYAAEIAYVDYCIGKVFDELKRLELYDDSLIIVTGDHGEMLGEHGEAGHQYFIYESALRVPLIVKLPGQREARRVPEVVGLIDIMPTVCSLARLHETPPVDGVDLMPLLVGEDWPSELAQRDLYCESVVPYAFGASPLFGQVGSRWKYIKSPRSELYDLQADPGENANLLSPEIVTDPQELQAYQMRARAMEDPIRLALARTLGVDASSPSEETLRRMASLGYVGGSAEVEFEFVQTRKDAKDTLGIYNKAEEAVWLIAAGKKDQALVILEALVREHPDLKTAQSMLAILRKEASQHDE